MKLVDRILELRKQKGLSQEQLADILGVSRQAVSKWESEQSVPDMDKIVLMSDCFEVTTDYLLKGIEPAAKEVSKSRISGGIVGGLGVIENDFHDRKDLSPNVCAVYTEEGYRGQGIAGRLLDIAVEDMRSKGISPLYLITNHVGFYERYGWEFL